MAAVLRVFPHDTGPWLVRAGRVRLGVPPGIGAILQPLDGTRPAPAILRERLAAAPGAREDRIALAARLAAGLEPRPFAWRDFLRSRFPVWVRLPLVPARVVSPLARRCAPLAGSRGLILLGLVGAAGLLAAGRVAADEAPAPSGSLSFAVGAALLVLSALWHELGHASALRASGYRPGGMGVGMLAVLPVFFVDVTPAALLPRAHRVRVNAAGPAFQFAAMGLYRSAALIPWLPPDLRAGLDLGAVSAALAVTWSLWPFIRSDGYWILCDALGLPGLDRPVPKDTGRTLRLVAGLLRLANAAFLALVAVGIVLALQRRFGLFSGAPGPVATAALGIVALVILGGLVARGMLLVRLAWHDVARTGHTAPTALTKPSTRTTRIATICHGPDPGPMMGP